MNFTTLDTPYIRVDGALVANGYADLTDGDGLSNNIDMTPTMQSEVDDFVWSNTRPSGQQFASASKFHCMNWGSGSDALGGSQGETKPRSDPRNRWTFISDEPISCDAEARLYCFGQ